MTSTSGHSKTFPLMEKRIRGKYPVYKIGDKIVIDGPEIVMEETDAICIHALAPLLHYVVALRDGAGPRELGLSKEKDVAYIQCVDPGEPYTEGGTVIFKCSLRFLSYQYQLGSPPFNSLKFHQLFK